MGPGFFVQAGGNNLFLNDDSHKNEDTLTSNGDGQSADGFGCHPNQAGDTNNVFYGCRAWWNSDNGWDFIHSVGVCIVEYSWSWYAGYKPDAVSGGKPVPLVNGNGNGFKGGGYDMPPTLVPTNPPLHILQMNASFYNKDAGFYANHSPISQFFYNNTSYMNGTDYNMLGVGSDLSSSISVGTLRNNIAFGGALTSNMNLGGSITDSYNSWDTGMPTVSAADFQSVTFAPPASCPAVYVAGGTVCVPPTDTVSFAGMASQRQPDGSLPDLPFLRLATGSPLIAKGTPVGLPYSGTAPDLGCFQTGEVYDPTDGGTSSGTVTSSSSSGGVATSSSSSGGAATSTSSSGGVATSTSSSGGVHSSGATSVGTPSSGTPSSGKPSSGTASSGATSGGMPSSGSPASSAGSTGAGGGSTGTSNTGVGGGSTGTSNTGVGGGSTGVVTGPGSSSGVVATMSCVRYRGCQQQRGLPRLAHQRRRRQRQRSGRLGEQCQRV